MKEKKKRGFCSGLVNAVQSNDDTGEMLREKQGQSDPITAGRLISLFLPQRQTAGDSTDQVPWTVLQGGQPAALNEGDDE